MEKDPCEILKRKFLEATKNLNDAHKKTAQFQPKELSNGEEPPSYLLEDMKDAFDKAKIASEEYFEAYKQYMNCLGK